MKKIILFLSVFFISVSVSAQGIDFQKDSYADLLKKAKKEKKAIFIDIYTSWCGPCKFMSENIFSLPEVGVIYNSKFINAKFDAEKSEDGKLLAKEFGVSAYPTLLFVNGDGELVYKFLGGRDKAGIIKEANKAVVAYNSLPELKKMEKKYLKGERSKEFLNSYFIARNNSGLDCGELLIEYFNLLTDNEILDSMNYRKIDKISKYDAALAKRIVDLTVKSYNDNVLDKRQFLELNRNVGKFLGGVLSLSAKNDNERDFDDILALKDVFFTIKGNSNSVTNASLGGGNLFIPSEMLRLDYYKGKKKPEKFIATMESYIAKLKVESVAKKSQQAAMETAISKRREEAEKSGDKDALSAIKQAAGLMGAFTAIDDYYISTTLIGYISDYEKIYGGEKNSAFDERIVGWYQFLSDMFISCKSAHYVAEQLIEKNRKAEAKEILQIAMDKGRKATAVEPSDIEKCDVILKTL